MKILNLRAENFKRISAIDITPDNDVVILSGANEQGKSSVLDAIMAAISGGRGMKEIPEPIKRGKDSAEVMLDLGDLKIRRVWEAGKTPRIEVTNADGAKFSSPQGVLDSLTGSLTFDPLEFARMPPREQRATLLRLVTLPFDISENDRQRAELVQEESAAKREASRLEDALKNIEDVPDDTPNDEISATELLNKLQTHQKTAQQHEQKRMTLNNATMMREAAESDVRQAKRRISDIEDALNEARTVLENEERKLANSLNEEKALAEEVDNLVCPDTSELEKQLASIDEVNSNVRRKKLNANSRALAKSAKITVVEIKSKITAHDKARAEALGSAQFPVDGLGFSEDGVTLNGIAFSQVSESQRIMTSAAMGMAMNPKLRVMFVRDGSALDSKRMTALSEMATTQDFQLWVEKVDESGDVGIVIEDGCVKTHGKNERSGSDE